MIPGFQNQNPQNAGGISGVTGAGTPLTGILSDSAPPMIEQLAVTPDDMENDTAAVRPSEGTKDAKPKIKSAETVCPKAFKDTGKRAELAILLYDVWQAGGQIKAANEKRINRAHKMLRNRPEIATLSGKPWSKAPTYNIPMISPRIKQRIAHIVDTVTSPSPMFYINRVGDDDRAKDIEDDLEFMLKISGFRDKFRDVMEVVASQNETLLKVDFVDDGGGNPESSIMGRYVGPIYDVVEQRNACVFPANHPLLENNRCVGHRFEMRRADILAKQKVGTWFSDPRPAGSDIPIRTEDRFAKQEEGRTQSDKDDNVWLFDCLVRFDADDDGLEEVYRVIADADQYDIYRIEPYECSESNYTVFRIKKDQRAFWCEDSVVSDAQPLQLVFNEIFNQVIYAFMYSTRPAVATKGVDSQVSTKDLKPGTLLNMPNLQDLKTLSGTLQLAGLDVLVNTIMSLSDSVTNVPDTISGGPTAKANELATTQHIKFTGFQLSGSDDVKAIMPALVATAKIMLWYMYQNFNRLKECYGDAIKTQDGDLFWQSYDVSVAGTTPQASPDVQQQEITNLLQMFAVSPQLQPLIIELVEKYVNSTSLEGKDDLVNEIQQIREQQDQAQKAQALQALLGQLQQAQGGGQPVAQPNAPQQPGSIPVGVQ